MRSTPHLLTWECPWVGKQTPSDGGRGNPISPTFKYRRDTVADSAVAFVSVVLAECV